MLELAAMDDEQSLIPIDVGGGQYRRIALRSTRFLQEFVELFSFRIALALDDAGMLIPRDRPFLAVADHWPYFLGKNPLREPIEIEGEIVHLAQKTHSWKPYPVPRP